jgi:hypothetical protein
MRRIPKIGVLENLVDSRRVDRRGENRASDTRLEKLRSRGSRDSIESLLTPDSSR